MNELLLTSAKMYYFAKNCNKFILKISLLSPTRGIKFNKKNSPLELQGSAAI